MRWLGLATSAILIGAATLGAAPPASAQTSTATGYYAPGWDMVAASMTATPPQDGSLFFYVNGQYLQNIPGMRSPCAGAWAYFNRRPSVSQITGSAAGTAECQLTAGWTMVGNPFSTAALLPSGTLAYFWDSGAYQTVQAIPLGGAVWIYSDTTASITLQAAPAANPTLTIPIPPVPPGAAYQAHVGDTVRMVAGADFPFFLGVDPRFLALESAGSQGISTVWEYRAMTPGTTRVSVTMSCYFTVPACLGPTLIFTINIAP